MKTRSNWVPLSIMASIFFTLLAPCIQTVAADDSNNEIGIWWIEEYHDVFDLEDLEYCEEDAEGFRDEILTDDDWSCTKNYSNDNARESHFENTYVNGDDSTKADSVDIFYFSGHGNYKRFYFGTDYDGDDYYEYRVYANEGSDYNEPMWGDTDLEWAFLSSCRSLGTESYADEWNDAFVGLHGICSFKSNCEDLAETGEVVASYLTSGYSIEYSWREGTEAVQSSQVYAAIYFAKIRIDSEYYYYGTDDELNYMYPDYDGEDVILRGFDYDDWECEGG